MTTSNLDNVTIYYSADGVGLEFVDEVVMEGDPEWGDCPWVVPDAPSTGCVIRISGYFGEAPEQSGVFEIRAVTDTDDDGMDDGWEIQQFGDMSHDADTDADGDGQTDYEEFMAGTDPQDSDADAGATFSCEPQRRPAGTAAAGMPILALVALAVTVCRRRLAQAFLPRRASVVEP